MERAHSPLQQLLYALQDHGIEYMGAKAVTSLPTSYDDGQKCAQRRASISLRSLTGDRHTTLVPAAFSDSYEEITILPVIDYIERGRSVNTSLVSFRTLELHSIGYSWAQRIDLASSSS